MKDLAKRIYEESIGQIKEIAQRRNMGNAQAEWFKLNGLATVEKTINNDGILNWYEKAKNLGYKADDFKVKVDISNYNKWYDNLSFVLDNPAYKEIKTNKFSLPLNEDFKKDFIMPFIEEENRITEEEKQAKLLAKQERENQARKIQEQRERIKLELKKDKESWIQEFGSDYLKRATKLDYDCQRQYVAERVDKEFPDYLVDFDDEFDWKERVCPSEEALNEVEQLINKGYNAIVVWLTDGIDVEFEVEAIAIREYLNQYDLVKTL